MYHQPATVPAGQIESVLIVDDHPLYSDALEANLKIVFEDCEITKSKSLKDALKCLDDGVEPDLVMFDLKLPDVRGISGFQSLRDRKPDTPILVISSLTSIEVVHALMERGAAGFLPKDSCSEVLGRVVTSVIAGERYVPTAYRKEPRAAVQDAPKTKLDELTPQQQKIMRLICSGKANKQIAYELNLAEATVKAHITALLRRLGVQNRTQAAMLMEGSLAANSNEVTDPDALAFLTH
ncbi:LuxR C-terminal-related transcriptional regulator [Donghicola tyrosinivorans]|uniref:DNA-binding NarL/FixJ family response regulator n=1 Tax=Donghicola tyrosinivorans TaxID=1652492 RepID=A0A2T0X0R9_9RHOB|nr:response regulator transcription factor [Donghicola tyrosinivorans]MEC9197938.1 response regulator transcription factor [Pseudomonadota bacterium]MEE3071119.1 response regulator transcription factor [Pseudomonadota bacterium]PRY92553.1 DNA-binding NarL/FixJ family response regulator [Donghicola tyrosinivorans]